MVAVGAAVFSAAVAGRAAMVAVSVSRHCSSSRPFVMFSELRTTLGPARAAGLCRSGRSRSCRREEDDGDAVRSGPMSPWITPIGPFCHFRSESDLGATMSTLSESTPQFATEMARIQLDAQMGHKPDPDRVRELADVLERSYLGWEMVLTKLRLSDDFQNREYYKLTERHLARQGKAPNEVGLVVKYQVQCMRAFAQGVPPPPPPLGLDMSAPTAGPGAGAMSAPSINAEPFTGRESLFESSVTSEEYNNLCRDHSRLIELGAKYGTFDPLGKIAFVDQIEAVEERWDVFFGRVSLVGQLNPEFKEQSESFLTSMGLGSGEFRILLKQVHEAMRSDAERERDMP